MRSCPRWGSLWVGRYVYVFLSFLIPFFLFSRLVLPGREDGVGFVVVLVLVLDYGIYIWGVPSPRYLYIYNISWRDSIGTQ